MCHQLLTLLRELRTARSKVAARELALQLPLGPALANGEPQVELPLFWTLGPAPG